MHQTNRFLACVILLMITLTASSQQTPKTLLWRITGKGLSKPSYLFGTMHLTDKRLFNFSDSVYHGIETTEGFAVEIDFREYMDSVFKSSFMAAEDELLARQEVELDKKLLGKEADSLLKQFGIKGNSVNKKQLKKIRDFRLGKIIQKGEMETIVDGFLYGVAMKNGKWLGAVEDVSDQLNLSDELGGELSPDQVFVSEKDMKSGIEAMISVYLKEDLEALNQMIANYSEEYKKAILTNRNFKMATRIDSLTAIRSMFIAVGAAHLPGEAGLISLLRKRGFQVEPVLSQKRIAGTVYAKKLSATPWHQVKSTELPYVIDMPGIPSDHNLFGENIKMKLVFDLTTMSFYMSGFAPGAISSEKDLDKAFAKMSEELAGREIKPKKIEGKDFEGREGIINTDEASFKVQIISAFKNIYILFAGTSKPSAIHSDDVKKYFASFKPVEIRYEKKEGKIFTIPGKAFSVMLPGEPQKNSTIERQAEGTSMSIAAYDLTDNANEKYYMVMVKEVGEGSFLTSDSVYFQEYLASSEAKFETVRKEITEFKGFPCLYFDGMYQGTILYKTFQVLRGGRIYFLMAGGKKDEMQGADEFFQSFQFLEYPEPVWSKQSGPGFFTSAPSPIQEIIETDEEKEAKTYRTFSSHDKKEAVSYSLVKHELSPYYWVKDKETWLEENRKMFVEENDSLLSSKEVMNGGLPALELLIKKSNSHNILKLRILSSGNNLYNLLTYIPQPYLNKPYHHKFFDDFRLENELPSNLFKKKTGLLMDSLLSSDSAAYQRAAEALSNTEFTKEDLPLLHQALLKEYNDSLYYLDVRDELAQKIINIGDSSTVDFIVQNYAASSTVNGNLQYLFLGILAGMYTDHSYKTLQSLLEKGLPAGNDKWLFERGLRDSLELSSKLLPQLLTHTNDSLFTDAVYAVLHDMVQKGHINIAALADHRKVFLTHAQNVLVSVKKDQETWYRYYDWLSFIGLWNEKESNDLLKEFMKVPALGLKRLAIKELLLNDQVVPASEILLVAKDTMMRSIIYNDLVEMKKISLMPLLYGTQKSIAESELYEMATDDNDVASIHFAGEQVVTSQGKKVKYLLYRIVFNTDEGTVSYLGVAGPYDPLSKQVVTGASHMGIYWEEPYDKLRLSSQLNKYREGL